MRWRLKVLKRCGKLTINRLTRWLPVIALLTMVGCANVTPVTRERETVAFDGNEQNGGWVRFLPNGSAEITPSKRDLYNWLIYSHGSKAQPPVERDFGIKKLDNGNFEMTLQAAETYYDLKLMAERERIRESDTLWNKIK